MTTRKAAAKKPAAKKAPAKRATAKKPAVKKAPAKRAPAKRPAAKKAEVQNDLPLVEEENTTVGETVDTTVAPTVEQTVDQAIADEIAQLEAEQAAEDKLREEAEKPEPVIHDPAPAMLTGNLKPLIGLGFTVLAAKLGEEWQLTQSELDNLSVAVGNVAAMYLPKETTVSPWMGLGLTVAAITVPRAAVTLMKPKGNQPSQQPSDNGRGQQSADGQEAA